MESFDTQASSKLFLWVRNQVLEMTADFLTTQREGGGVTHIFSLYLSSQLYIYWRRYHILIIHTEKRNHTFTI